MKIIKTSLKSWHKKMLKYAFLLLALGSTALADDPAIECESAACLLPDCLCSTTTFPPGVTDITEYPQIVMLSFDGTVEQTLYDAFYSPLFNYTNPNQCQIGLTFYISQDYTEYDLVHDLWQRGHEIASHSITDDQSIPWMNLGYQGWVDEMYGMKLIASRLANIPLDDIVGARAPFLQINGDVMMQALFDTDFLYDSSMPTQKYTYPPLFPYTFDYKSIQDCEIPPCPVDSYPGFWEVPLVDFNATYPCSMLDSCTGISGENETFQFLLSNFNKHYLTNRAPIGLFTHASWFQTDVTHYPGYLDFIDYLHTLPDVYIVTVKNAIEWMKNPTKLADLAGFAPWACDSLPSSDCTPQTCVYTDVTPGGERYMKICTQCPVNYPWLGDPFGNNTAPPAKKI